MAQAARKQESTVAPVTNVNAVNARSFGKSVGKGDAADLEKSDALHASFKKSDTKGQAAIKRGFTIGYLCGRLDIEGDEAADVLKKGRGKGVKKDHALALMGASQKFLYLVARTGNKSKGGTGVGRGKGRVAKARIAPVVLDSVAKLFEQAKGKTLADQRDYLIEAIKQVTQTLVAEAEKEAAAQAE